MGRVAFADSPLPDSIGHGGCLRPGPSRVSGPARLRAARGPAPFGGVHGRLRWRAGAGAVEVRVRGVAESHEAVDVEAGAWCVTALCSGSPCGSCQHSMVYIKECVCVCCAGWPRRAGAPSRASRRAERLGASSLTRTWCDAHAMPRAGSEVTKHLHYPKITS